MGGRFFRALSLRCGPGCAASFAALLVWLGVGAMSAAPAATPSVPANYMQHQDSLGFGWQLTQNGTLGNDGRGCFQYAFHLMINGMQVNYGQQLMTPDGQQYLFTGSVAQQLESSRHVKLDLKQGIVQYVDSFKNPTSSAVTANVVVNVRFGNPAQTIVTDQGKPFTGPSSSSETGLLVVSQQNMPSPLLVLGGPKAKVRPMISNQGNFQLAVSYSVPVPAGKTVSLAYAIAQRNVAGVPDAKATLALFKPLKQASLLREFPNEVRRTIVNEPGGNATFDFNEGLELPDAIMELSVTRGPHDMLLIGQDTRLRGTLGSQPLAIQTRLGPQQLAMDKIAAIFGGNGRQRSNRLILRDGQVLVGSLDAKELKFTLNSGLDAVCSLSSVDRFVLREQPGDGEPGPEVFAYVDLPGGDRLAIVPGEQQKITAVTAWGNREIPLNDLQLLSISGRSQGTAGHRLVLADGSSFVAFISEGTLKLATTNYGTQEFAVLEIQRIRAARYKPSSSGTAQPVVPHAVLAGGNLFVGQVDLPVIHFESQGQTIPIAPPQIKVLRRHEADDDSNQTDRPLYRAELWDGDVVVATLHEELLPLRTGTDVLQVPLADLVELHVPTPTVPESLRSRITELLADLGNPEWRRREAASKELLSLGAIAQQQCQEALQQATDPEVRKRVQALLDAMKE